MAAEFVGYPNVSYVEQPPGSEQCFAAIVSAVSGAPIHESQRALYQAGLVEENGGTGAIIGQRALWVAGTTVSIEMLEVPEKAIEMPEPPKKAKLVLALFNKQFAKGKGVALLHKKNGDPKSTDYHWILLTGYHDVDGHKGPIHTIDPLPDERFDLIPPGPHLTARNTIAELIMQSMDYENGGIGIFPHSISTDAPLPDAGRQLKIVPAYDREPEPIEDTYTATGQDKVVAFRTS